MFKGDELVIVFVVVLVLALGSVIGFSFGASVTEDKIIFAAKHGNIVEYDKKLYKLSVISIEQKED